MLGTIDCTCHMTSLLVLVDPYRLQALINEMTCRIPLQMVSPQLFSVAPSPPSPFNGFLATLANATSYSTASSSSSIDPWASPSQSGGPLLSKSKRNLDSALGNRSRNSSAAFEELARLRSVHVSNDNAAHEQVPVNSSM